MDTKYLEIIKGPVVTEKSGLAANQNKYSFKVDPRSTKLEIKNAIEKIFKVKVERISTLIVKPKKKKVGRYTGLSNRIKKAIVTLKDGQKIDLN